MKESFKDAAAKAELGPQEGVQVDDVDSSAAIALRGAMALGQITGEIDVRDFKLPRLNIAYGVGKFVGKFNPGSLVMGDDNLLVNVNTPLTVTILSAVKYWKEWINNAQWRAGIKPRVFMTGKEVLAVGGTTDYGADGTPPSFAPAMDLKLLIQKPTDISCGLFGVDLPDGVYAPAIWTVDKTAYKRVGPVVLSTQEFALRKRGLISGVFELKTVVEKIRQSNVVVPNIRMVAHRNDEFIENLKRVFGDVK